VYVCVVVLLGGSGKNDDGNDENDVTRFLFFLNILNSKQTRVSVQRLLAVE
jgi:hypothetical protein